MTSVNIPAGPLASGLNILALQSRVQILMQPSLVRGLQARALRGAWSREAAFTRLLAGTGLRFRMLDRNVVLIERIPPTPTPSARPMIDDAPSDIVITALRRSSLSFDTAISVSSRRGVDLARRGIKDLNAAAQIAPGLNLTPIGAGLKRLSLRGVQSAGEPTISVYYDEVPVSGPAATTFDPSIYSPDLLLIDVDRVEVLQGPQGTLYGGSAMGGTVRILFNRPDLDAVHGDAEGEVSTVAKGGTGTLVSGVLNLPLVTGTAGLRLVGYHRADGGYIDHPRFGLKNADGAHDEGLRAALDLALGGGLLIGGTFATQRSRVDDATFWYAADGRYRNNQQSRAPYASRFTLYNLTAKKPVGSTSLFLSLSHYDWNTLRTVDFTNVLASQRESGDACARYFPGIGQCSPTQRAAFATYVDSRLPGILEQPIHTRSTIAEARLSSAAGSQWSWILGAFAERRRDYADSFVFVGDPLTGHIADRSDLTAHRMVFNQLNQNALFGEVTAPITSALSATGGLRYFDYRRRSSGAVIVPNIITGTELGTTTEIGTRDRGVASRLQLSLRASSNFNLYVQAAQGFRPGGVNILPNLAPALIRFSSDNLWSYELGAKYRAPDRAFSVEMAIYAIDWDNIIYPTSNLFGYNVNIGNARHLGAELHLTGRIRPGFSTALDLTFVDARLTSINATTASLDLGRKGNRIPSLPRMTMALEARYQWQAAAGLTAAIQGNGRYISGTHSQFNASVPDYRRLKGYAVADLSASLSRGRYEGVLFIQNALNNGTIVRQVSSNFGQDQTFSLTPRQIGIRLGYHF